MQIKSSLHALIYLFVLTPCFDPLNPLSNQLIATSFSADFFSSACSKHSLKNNYTQKINTKIKDYIFRARALHLKGNVKFFGQS